MEVCKILFFHKFILSPLESMHASFAKFADRSLIRVPLLGISGSNADPLHDAGGLSYTLTGRACGRSGAASRREIS